MPFAPMCVRLGGRAVSCRVRASVRVGVPGEVFRSGGFVWPEGARVRFAKLRPPGCLVHVRAGRLPFAPMCVRSGGRAVSCRVRASVRVGSFGPRAPVSDLLSCDRPGALCTSGRAVCRLLPCASVRVGRAVSRRVMAFVPVGVLGEGVRSGRVVWPDGARVRFAKLRPPGCLVHVRAARLPFAPMCVRLVGRAVSRRERASVRVGSFGRAG